jgi:predicted nucleotidyltransferase
MDKQMWLQQCLQQHPYPVLFASITGSHVYGFATELSDYDVHGVHCLPLEQIVGLSGGDETIERKYTEQEPEVEVTTHDLKKFILLLLKGNGNVLEVLYSPLELRPSPIQDELWALGKGCISKLCAAHYKGMASNQQRRIYLNDVKKLLHIYRCLLMSIHLMRSGILVMDIPTLAREYQQPQVLDVIEQKKSGIEGLDHGELNWHEQVLSKLHERLDEETQRSQMPEKTSLETRQRLEALLIRERIRAL